MAVRLFSRSNIFSGVKGQRFNQFNFNATGGTISNITIDGIRYKLHTFTTSGTFTVNSGTNQCDILMVAGGASGAKTADGFGAGGGGAGGLEIVNLRTFSPGSFTVTVGAGGAQQTAETTGNDGVNSSVVTSGGTVSVTGGGGGGIGSIAGRSGGSGGGGGADGTGRAGGAVSVSGEGNVGGDGFGSATTALRGGGGGGGAGGVGVTSTSGQSGAGGPGLDVSSFFGQPAATTRLGGGGGGCGGSSSADGAGGSGGGGAGGRATGGVAGTNGTGGGGGAALVGFGGKGGDGIVYIRYVG